MRKRWLNHQQKIWSAKKTCTQLPLFLDMRLGKTLLALRWAAIKDAEKILVICPSEVIASWEKELTEDSKAFVALRGTKPQKLKLLNDGLQNGVRFFITNYEALCSYGNKTKTGKPLATPSEIASVNWDCIIADESTKIRSPKAQITKIFIKHLSKAKYKAILSGLPNPEGPADYVTQFIFLFGSFMGQRSYYDWRFKHMFEMPYGGWELKAKSRKLIKNEVSGSAVILTRKQAGIDYGKIREVRRVRIPAKCHAAIKSAKEFFEVGEKLTNNILVTITWCARIAGGRYGEENDNSLHHDAKIKEAINLATGDLKKEPLVFWARYTDEINALHIALKKVKRKGAVINGEEKNKKNNRSNIKKFMSGKLDYLVCQPKSIQMGIDLSIAATAIYLSNYHSYEMRAQTEDRIIHPQKKQSVLIIDIVAEDTPDEFMPEILSEKSENSKEFFSKLRRLL